MAMYKNREVSVVGVVEETVPAKVRIEYASGGRETVNKSEVVVFDKNEVPESKIVLKDGEKKVEDWQEGYAVPTEEHEKIHENNMKLMQAQAENRDATVEFKPALDKDLKPASSQPSQPVAQPVKPVEKK